MITKSRNHKCITSSINKYPVNTYVSPQSRRDESESNTNLRILKCMRNDIKNKNKNGENEMNNNNKNIHLMNLDGHTNADGIVRFKENTHEWKLSQEMNGESDFIHLTNKQYRGMKKACRHGRTTTITIPRKNNQEVTISKVGKDKYQSNEGQFVINLKSFNLNKIDGYLGNSNSLSGSLISHALVSGVNVNKTIDELDNYELKMNTLYKEVA